jgi:hypothetical protein
MLVTRVIGDCPGCGTKNSFGNVSVGTYILRGCKHCAYQKIIPLPPLKKKVIYLDQFFFSGAMRGEDSRFLEAAELIKRMSHLQLLVAPYSSVHEDETHQWRGYKGMTKEQLMAFIRSTARGAKFEHAYSVESTQITRAWEVFLNNQPLATVIDRRDAISGLVTTWDDYFYVSVNVYFGNTETKRKLKREAGDQLIKTLDHWQNSKQTFDEAVALENRDAGYIFVNEYLKARSQIANGELAAVFNRPMSSMVVDQLMHWLTKDQAFEARIQRCIDFFRSAYFSETPSNWLSAHIYATLREMVKHGAFSNRDDARSRLGGIFDDVAHISTYAPYCDAIVIDKFMADLVNRPTVSLRERYGTKVFSLSNWDELIKWLTNLELDMSEEHKAGVAAAYP